MQVNAVNFTTDYNLPVQQTERHFENSKPKAQVVSKPEKEIEKTQETDDLSKLKNTLAESNITLKFSRDDRTNAIVVELVNERTGEAIRQIPSEVSLKLAAEYIKTQGQFIDETK